MGYKLKTVALSLTLAAGFALGVGVRSATITPPQPPNPLRYIDMSVHNHAEDIAALCDFGADNGTPKVRNMPVCKIAADWRHR